MQFSHLHCHTQFSLLDGAANIASMMKKAKEDNMPAVAITDHGNMFGAFQFVAEAAKVGVKPIVGCEFYVVHDRHKKQFTKEDKDQRCHQLFLAKNPEGYKNLIKMCSLGFMEGMYGKYPRIDKELILKYHKGLIATTCCIGAEVPRTILKKGEAEGEKVFKWWLDLFGDDYYVELQRHDIPEQKIVNEVLIKFALKHNVKIIASNDSHYVDQKDWNAHDILLCINTGEKQATPTMKEFSDDDQAFKGKRFAFYNDQFYFKKTSEMATLFSDLPQALDNTNEIVDKVETLKLKKDILLPAFPIPKEFQLYDDNNLNQWEYLRHITFEGAKKRYGEIDAKTQERLDFELFTIKTMGFAGYFLIVGDFIEAGRNIGVFVGPGRGSAAGSVVAYCIGITNIDPIKYDLLFERFLNPDRKSMPDIDTDFDDEGRQKVIDYVVDKYGKNQVAQIVTYGTMAAKMSIKDVARVLDLPLQESNGLAKLVPDKPGINLGRVLHAPLTAKEGEKSLEEKEGIDMESLQNVRQLREIYHQKGTLASDVLREAEILEGSVRGTGIHAAGIIIAPSDLSDLIPVAVAKDSSLLVTQFEGKVIEDAGVIKMDFLGLKTLTIIKNTLKIIKKNKGVDIVIDDVDLEDMKTFELFQRGETEGVFQFESPGMKKYMKELKPDKFGDIIAMNALYRPGPIAYIPNYINRKHGREEIVYDLPEMEEYLKDTYGITVYQEQVMLLSQKIGGFTKGQADVLRKAMGKKDRKTLDALKETFLKGAQEKGHPVDKLEKIWTDWEAFAQYAFNKSHSTCYAFVAFQTAWLKSHYPSEYMAANLTNEKDNIEKVTYFLEETKRMGIKVLGPNVNKSDILFDVDSDDNILFGLGGVKGTGEAATQAIIDERAENGPFKSIFDFASRVNLRTVNKKTFEVLAQGGGFDSFEDIHRAQYFATDPNETMTFLEKVIKYGAAGQEQKNSSQQSMFGGGAGNALEMPTPKPPKAEPWNDLTRLRLEKDVVGIYLSGHPLDQFKLEYQRYCKPINELTEVTQRCAREKRTIEVTIAGIVSNAFTGQTKTGKPYGKLTLEDYEGSYEIALFGNDYVKFANYLIPENFLMIKGNFDLDFRKKAMLKENPNEAVMETDYRFNPVDIQLLAEVKDKYFKGIKISFLVEELSPKFIDHIENTLKEHIGTGTVQFKLVSQKENINVDFKTSRIKINPSNELVKDLEKIGNMKIEVV